MDDALVPNVKDFYISSVRVLILVVMDDALVQATDLRHRASEHTS